jgi:hypothetical protein
MGLSLKGRQIVAGGRSVAQTTGQQSKIIPHPERVSEKTVAPLQGADRVGHPFPVVFAALRPPATV